MKILHLTLKKKWFDLIASGEKIHEFRQIKPYWEKRLLDEQYNPIKFDEVRFRNGYKKDAPFMRVKWLGMAIGLPKWWWPKHGENIDKLSFIIQLGSVLEVRP